MSIGHRIKIARKAKKLSQRALAKAVGVSAMAISKYERDEDVPGSGVLARLALAVEMPLDFFFRPQSRVITLRAYRKHASLPIKDEQAILARVQEWLERYLEVESLFPDIEPDAGLPAYRVTGLDEVEQAALLLREHWTLGWDPIENLTELLEDRGIRVGLVHGIDRFDACTLQADGEPVLVTRGDVTGDRQRFNLAHELGHAVLEPSEDLDEEKAAHRFAGAFLAPESAARRELGEERTGLDLNELVILKRKYGLSMQAWVYRARDLEIITPGMAGRLFRRFRSQGWHRREPGRQLPAEQPRRMELLIYRALAEDLVSRSRASELLGKPVEDFLIIEEKGAHDRSVRSGD